MVVSCWMVAALMALVTTGLLASPCAASLASRSAAPLPEGC